MPHATSDDEDSESKNERSNVTIILHSLQPNNHYLTTFNQSSGAGNNEDPDNYGNIHCIIKLAVC